MRLDLSADYEELNDLAEQLTDANLGDAFTVECEGLIERDTTELRGSDTERSVTLRLHSFTVTPR